MSINIFLLDKSKNTKEEQRIKRPNTFQELINQLRSTFHNLPEYYEFYIVNQKNEEIIINNEEKYKNINDILFISEIDNNNLGQSLFEINYDKLSESKQQILDEKYNCILCSSVIKKENPYFCYKCQKIFHEKCLKDWDNKCKSQNKNLECPNCRNKLAIENWNKKLDFEENRKYNANLLNEINNLNEKIKKNDEIKKYAKKTTKIFKNILKKINEINFIINDQYNNELNNLINMNPLNNGHLYLYIDDISTFIYEELDKLTYYIKINKTNLKDKIINDNQIINNYSNNSSIINSNYQINFKNNEKNINNNKNIYEENVNNFKEPKIYDPKKIIYTKEIKLIYYAYSKGNYDIFGKDFLLNNRNNLELFINGINNTLVGNYELKEGDNIISIKLKNKLINLSYMFYRCESLRNINDLKYLDVKEVKDFSYMFFGCSLLSDLTPLKNWVVSNANNFQSMFSGCSSLFDLKPLQYWEVSKVKNFNSMFSGCTLISDIKPLSNWNVSSGESFYHMFSYCSSLSDIEPLKNWSIYNSEHFDTMFFECPSLSNKNFLSYNSVLNNNNNNNNNYFEGNFYKSLNNYNNYCVNETLVSKNGLLNGIINNFEEIEFVIRKIQYILNKKIFFNLEYKASNIGDRAETFHLICDNLTMSLVIIETDKNIKFGGFTTKTWKGNNLKKIDNDAFVFNLGTNSIFDVIKYEPAIGCYPKFGPVFFGCQIRIYDNFFTKGGTTCHKGLNYKTTKDYELNNGEQKFLVKDMEIYGISTT